MGTRKAYALMPLDGPSEIHELVRAGSEQSPGFRRSGNDLAARSGASTRELRARQIAAPLSKVVERQKDQAE